MSEPFRDVRNLANVPDEQLQTLGAALGSVRTLGDLMEWARSHEPKLPVDDITTQDEYTHDVLVPLELPLWLAFDVT